MQFQDSSDEGAVTGKKDSFEYDVFKMFSLLIDIFWRLLIFKLNGSYQKLKEFFWLKILFFIYSP